MKLATAVAALAALGLSLFASLPVTAEQNPYTQASENSSAFIARFPNAHQMWDNIAKFEINPAFRTLFSNSYGTSCAAITSPYPYQWCVDATTRQVYLNTQPAGGGAFSWRSAFSLNPDGTLNQASIANGSVTGVMLAPGAAANNLGFTPVQSVAGRGGNVALSAGDISGLAASATTDTTNASNIASGTLASGRLPGTIAQPIAIAANSTVPVTLAAQADPILRSSFISGSTTSENAMEFFDAGQITAATGSVITKLAADNYKRAKVAHYRAITGGASAGDMYAGNWLCNSELGHNGNCIAGELDLNDANTSQNSAVSFADLQAGLNVRSGLYISGSTVNPVSGGILINMAANGFKAQRGIGVFNGTIAGDVYDDNVDAPSGNVLRSVGSKAGGIELSGLTIASGVAVDLKQGHQVRWINGAGTQTSTISTDGSNILQLGTGAAGVNLASPLSSVKMSVVTVASLPTCNSGTKGTMQAVSDAAASPVYNATVAGGGSVSIPVYCDGTNWTNH